MKFLLLFMLFLCEGFSNEPDPCLFCDRDSLEEVAKNWWTSSTDAPTPTTSPLDTQKPHEQFETLTTETTTTIPPTTHEETKPTVPTTTKVTTTAATTSKTGSPSSRTTTTIKKRTTTSTPITNSSKTALLESTTPPTTPQKLTTESLTMNSATTHEKTSRTVPTTTKITAVVEVTTSKPGQPSLRTTTIASAPVPITTSSKKLHPDATTPPTTSQKVTSPEASTSRTVTESPITRTSNGKVDLPTTMTAKREETSSRTSNTVYSSRFFSKPTRMSTVHNGKTIPTTTTTKEGVTSTVVQSTSTTRSMTETHSSSTGEEKTETASSIRKEKLTSQATTVVDFITTTGKPQKATSTIVSTGQTSTMPAQTSGRTSSRSRSTVSQHPTDTLSSSKDVTTSQKSITSTDISSTMTTVPSTLTSDVSEQQATTTTRSNKIDWTTESDSSTSETSTNGMETMKSSTKGMKTMEPEERTTESTTEATTGNTSQRTTTAVAEHGNMTDPENVEVRTTTTKTQKSSKGYSSLTSATTPTSTTSTTERIVSSESPSSTVPTKSSTTSLLKTTIVPAQTTTTRISTTSSPHATDTNTTSTVTTGEDKSSTTVAVDTTPRTTLPKDSSYEPSTTVSTTSSTGATETSTVTALTTSTEEKTNASKNISSNTSTRVTDALTKISENTSTEKGETHASTTEKKYSRPVTTQTLSATMQQKESATTITELPTPAKQAETAGKISTTSLVSSTVPIDTTTTEPTTQDLETNEKRTTTLYVTTTTTSSGSTATLTTPSENTEDKPTTNVQQTTGSDLSTSEEQDTVTSLKRSTMGESRKPSDTTRQTENGSTEKTSNGETGTTSQRTTTGTVHDPHSEPSASHTTEAQRETDHSSPEHPTTSATGTTGVPHQDATTKKKTVTAQPAEGETVRSSEQAVDTVESGETTTAPSGPVEHFTDINVGEDKSSTTVPEYCSLPCPNGFTEGANYCYMIPPKEKSTTYTMAISFCQEVASPRSDLATSYDYQDNDNLELFKGLLDEANRTTDKFFVNMLASASFRKNLQAEIISLSSTTRFLFPVIAYAGSSQSLEHVNSICRTTKFCKPNTCSFKQFTDLNKEEVVGLPKRKELTAGESIVVRCIQYNTSQVHTIACAETGSFKVHPSMVKCIAPADFEEIDHPSPWDPLYPADCSWCLDEGTQECTNNPTGPGVKCVCREGWTKRTCWKSPDLCTSETCGEHGQCVSLVDHTECVCEYGMIGERCTVNATKTSWFGTNETLAIWDVRSLGVAAQASSTFVLIGLKFLSKILIVGECEDPQDTYQDYRHALQTIGNLAAVFFTHPDMFGVDAIGCRFFFWMITVCYTLGLVFWVNESINVYTTVRAVHRNTWNKNFAGEDKKYLRFAPRVIVPFLIGVFAILLLMANSWNTVGTSWSCFGSFSSDATSTWYPLCAGNAALALLAISFAEATSLLIKNRPHTLVRLHNWFNLNQPANFEIVGKVERNRYFTAIGPILHFLTWATLTVASDKNTLFMDSMSFFLGMTYVGFNFVQMVFTSPAYYAWACIAAMMILPERWSPNFEWTNLRNREEVLARYYKRRYKKEQDRKILDEDERKANEQREVDEKNAKLLQKYPNLPSTLLFHCPEEPPVHTLPRPFPFDPSGKEYMTSFQREHLARIWTRSYLETRKFHKKSPEKSAFEVVKKEIQRNIFQVKTEDRKKQELFALAQWWNSVPAMDRTKLREHKNTVIMEDEEETDLIAFEREVSRLASIIDLRENRKRKGLLKDKETDPFKKTADFLKFEPAEAIKCVLFETVDGLGDVVPKKFLKKPPIVLKRQIDEYDKAYSHGVAELNKPFDKTYDDDLMVTQWSDTEHSEAVKEIMNVSPSQIGEQPISMNPRKRPLDEFWFDHERPDFVGPRQKHEIPIGPYEEYARKCHYYQSLTDAQWSQIEHNSYHMANLRKIRRGEL